MSSGFRPCLARRASKAFFATISADKDYHFFSYYSNEALFPTQEEWKDNMSTLSFTQCKGSEK